MSTQYRRIGRECALKVLFALRHAENPDPDQALREFWGNFRFADDALGEPVDPRECPTPDIVKCFAEQLVRGIIAYRPVLDREISAVAKNWSLDRINPVDISILRMACYEILYLDDIPAPVTMNEAIEIAKRYGTKESPAFVNGLLDKVANRAEAHQKNSLSTEKSGHLYAEKND